MGEIKMYGGDAYNTDDLECGDEMTIWLINNAIAKLLPEAYLGHQRINVMLTDIQMMQIKPKREELYAMIYFLPINTYDSNEEVQEAILSCGKTLIKIYTSKE